MPASSAGLLSSSLPLHAAYFIDLPGSLLAQADASNASSWIKTTLMLEEYLDGPEVDVDLIISEGEAVYGAITDNWPTVEPYFNETGSNCPSILPASHQRELMDLAVASVHSLGLQMVRLHAGRETFHCANAIAACGIPVCTRNASRAAHAAQGVFHVELKYTSHGPRLIEVNCRMGGGPVRATNLLVWGVDLVEEQLLCSAGIPSRPPIAAKPLMYIAEYSVNAKVSGRVMNTDFCKVGSSACAASVRPCGDVLAAAGKADFAAAHLQEWENHPDVLYVRPLVNKGQKVTAVTDGMPTWVAELMVKKPSVEEAITFVTAIEQGLVIPVA